MSLLLAGVDAERMLEEDFSEVLVALGCLAEERPAVRRYLQHAGLIAAPPRRPETREELDEALRSLGVDVSTEAA